MWSPSVYVESSVLAREIGDEMMARLDWMTIQPDVILDVGCGAGEMAAQLQTRYKKAHVLALDNEFAMVQFAKQQHHQSCFCADAARLPLPDRTVDLIFANLLLPWYPNIPVLLREWRRVLRPQGLLMLTTLGLDTLREIKMILDADQWPQLVDMHDIGDLLLQEKFEGPVLDVNHYTLNYHSKEKLLNELDGSGMAARSVMIPRMNDILPSEEGTWPVTYEVIFAHAFMPEESEEISASSDGMVRIPLTHLRRQLDSLSSAPAGNRESSKSS